MAISIKTAGSQLACTRKHSLVCTSKFMVAGGLCARGRLLISYPPIFTRTPPSRKDGWVQDRSFLNSHEQNVTYERNHISLRAELCPPTGRTYTFNVSLLNSDSVRPSWSQVPVDTYLISLSTAFHTHLASTSRKQRVKSSCRARENAIVRVSIQQPARCLTTPRLLPRSHGTYPAPSIERQLPGITTTTMITHAAVSRETAPDRVRLHDSPGARERRERTAPAPPKKAPRWPQPVSARRWTRGAILS